MAGKLEKFNMNRKTKIAIIVGTRPEIIKMAPVIRECQRKNLDYFILHTGQHYSKNMDAIFFKELDLPVPKYNLAVGGEPYRKQVGIMVKNIMAILKREKPSVVIVQGDTISVLAGSLAANKLGIKLAHHEAGMRSHDTNMLEEVIRVIVDHISDFLMVPTGDSLINLQQEGKIKNNIFLTGNTIVDAVFQNIELSNKKRSVLKKLKLEKKGYILATCHRAENVEKKERLVKIINGFGLVANKFKVPVIFSIHPRTKNKMDEFGLTPPAGVLLIKPVGFLQFLQLEKNALLILTDSGGVQEEAFILGVPCVTTRDNTERPESLKCGMNILAGINPQRILKASGKMMGRTMGGSKKNIFGDGRAAKKIIEIICRE